MGTSTTPSSCLDMMSSFTSYDNAILAIISYSSSTAYSALSNSFLALKSCNFLLQPRHYLIITRLLSTQNLTKCLACGPIWSVYFKSDGR